MKRWAIVVLLLGLVAASLVGVRPAKPDEGPSDELVVYEVAGERGVEVGVPAGIDRLVLTTWRLVLPDALHDPARAYTYAVDIELVSGDGTVVLREREEATSRVSGDPNEPLEDGRFAARLADGSAWVTDSRSRSVELSALRGARGAVRLRAVGEAAVLARLAHAESRSALTRRWKERTLDARDRSRVIGHRSALGFGDLPESARDRALGFWGRRLTARGRAGSDFVSRRLLVGDYRADAGDPHAPAPLPIGPGRQAVFNLGGPATVRVEAPAGTELVAIEGTAAPVTQAVGDSGRVDFPLHDPSPRTVRIGSDRSALVRFTVNAADSARLLGLQRGFPRGSFLEIRPDVLRHRCFSLGPGEPVAVDVFPGQDRVGITVRGLAAGRGSEPVPIELGVRWIGAGAVPEPVVERASLPRSEVERFGVEAVSEPTVALLRVPPGAARFELFGTETTLVSVWAREPDVAESRPKPGYDVVLPPGMVFRYAPREPRTWATLLPANAGHLARTGRELRIEVFPRIEAVRSTGRGEATERPLVARGAPAGRRLLSPIWFSPGATFESYHQTPVGEAPMRLQVAAKGPRAGRLAILYRADEERLGERLRLRIDGEEVLSRELLTRRGELEVPASPGSHEVALEGLGAQGLALIDAPPAEGGEVARAQSVVALPVGREVRFTFTWEKGEIGSLLLFFATEGGAAPVRVAYRIDRGELARAESGLLRRITELEGVVSDRTGAGPRGLLWEARVEAGAPRWSSAITSGRVALGDDLAPGEHELTLRALPVEGARPLWVRGMLVGRAEDPAEEVEP